MVFDFRKFIEGGGSKTITDPAEQQRVFREAVEESRRSSRGGGGSSRRGGGGSSGGGGISAAEVERKRQAEIARIAELKRQQEEAQRLADKLKAEREQKAFGQTVEGQVNINVSGGVTVGGVKYSGTAIIPGTGGMTANAYAKSVKGGLVKTGQIDVKDYGRTGVTLKTGDETLTTGEKVIYDMFGVASGVEADLGRGRQSFSIGEYKKEVERIQRDSPKTAVLDTSTGALSSGTLTPVKLGGADLYPRNKVQVYTNPVTGDVIKDVGAYLKEKDIPTSTTPKKKDIFKAQPQPTYDILGVESKASKGEFGVGGAMVGEEWKPTSAAIGTVTPVIKPDFSLIKGTTKAYLNVMDAATSMGSVLYSKVSGKKTDIIYSDILPKEHLEKLDYKPLVRQELESKTFAGRVGEASFKYYTDKDIIKTTAIVGAVAVAPKAISFASKYLLTPKVIGSLEVADIIGYSTGANKIIGTSVKTAGRGMQITSGGLSGPSKYGLYAAGAVVEGIGYLPAESKTELAIDITLGAGFVSPYKAIKYPTKAAIAGYSGYQVITAPTAGLKVLGGLGLFAVSPEIVKAGRAGAFKLSPDYVKTKTGATGIKYTDVDLGKLDYNVDKSILSVTKDPLRVEFVPSRKESFGSSVDPLKSLSQDIAYKTTPKLPKVTAIQQKIIDVTKEEGGIISGSFAQQTLIKDARTFKDIDVLSKDPLKLAGKLEQKYSDILRVEKKTITDAPSGQFDIYKVFEKKTGKHLADIDPLKFSEEGFARMFEPIEIGRKRLLPEAYASKLSKEGKLDFISQLSKKDLIGEGFATKEGQVTGLRGLTDSAYDGKKARIVVPKILEQVYGKQEGKITLAHELIHYKQDTGVKSKIFKPLDDALPYRLKPSEIQAFAFEKHFAKKGFVVEGLKLLPQEVRLTSKILQQARTLPTGKRAKVALDIAQLTGEKGLATSPSLLRGYGLSKVEQKTIFLGDKFYATHGGMNIIPRLGDKVLLGGEKVGSPELFYSTPSKVSSATAFARKSRMGLDVDVTTASFRDILRGEKLTFYGGRKQVLIEVGKLGDDFIQPMKGTSEIEVARVLPKEGKELTILKRFKTIIGGEPIEIAFAGKGDILKTDLKLDRTRLEKLGGDILDSTRKTSPKQVVISPKVRTSFGESNLIGDVRTGQDIFRIDMPSVRTDFIKGRTRVTKSKLTPRTTSRRKDSYLIPRLPIRDEIFRPTAREPIRPARARPTLREIRLPVRETRLEPPIRRDPFKRFEPGLSKFDIKLPKSKKKLKEKRNLLGQPTVYQPSFTGSVLNLRISKPGISPGGLSLRGILPTKKKSKKKKKKFSIL